VKLIRLELENFRQFRGTQCIDFADDHDRNVTVIYGANGAGKTTILNAFMWVLYETLGSDVEEPDRLITDVVWDSANHRTEVTCSVALHFEHNGELYRMRRWVTKRKNSHAQPAGVVRVSLSVRDRNGAESGVEAISDVIDQVLPRRLASFFLFNGERMEILAQRGADQHIQGAVKTLLGIDQFEQAIAHLPAVRSRFASEIRSLGRSPVSDIVDEQEALNRRKEALIDEREALTAEVASLNEEVRALNAELTTHKVTAQLQARRDDQMRNLRSAERRLNVTREELQNLLTKRAYLLWMTDYGPDLDALNGQFAERGDLPAPLKREFVDRRLEDGVCICGTALVPGEAPYLHVHAWRQRAGLADVESHWMRVRAMVKIVEENAADVAERLRNLQRDVAEIGDERRLAEEALNEIKGQLIGVSESEPQRLAERLDQHEKTIQGHGYRLRDIERELKAVEAELNSVGQRLVKARGESDKVELGRRRIEVIDKVAHVIQQMYDAASDAVRRRLDTRVREIHSKISIKPFTPSLGPNFELELWQESPSGPINAPKSTGENQLLSLSFVGALAAICRDHAEPGAQDGLMGKVGGLYPIAMDAAFGNLDSQYRFAVASNLPSLASQVVVLTSKAQIEGVAAEGLEPHVGKEYVITVNTSKSDAQAETMVVQGRAWDLVTTGGECDFSELREAR
jgi:DNA sulfur modification protein DndD